MRVTKEVLEAQLRECRSIRDSLAQDNRVLQRQLDFMNKLVSNQSMITAMETMTDALAHTVRDLRRRN